MVLLSLQAVASGDDNFHSLDPFEDTEMEKV